MPRKQRFKPSRKPKSPEVIISNQPLDDRKEIQADPHAEQRPPDVDLAARDVENDRG